MAASSAGGADDNHATALATVLVGRHVYLVGLKGRGFYFRILMFIVLVRDWNCDKMK